MFAPRALSTAVRNRGLPVMSPPPSRAEIVISLMIFVQTFDFFESVASFLCLIFDQRLCPDMPPVLPRCRGTWESQRDRHVWCYGGPQPGVAAPGSRVQVAA